MSMLVLPCRGVSSLVLPFLVLLFVCLVLSCPLLVLPYVCLVFSCRFMSCVVLSCLVAACRAVSCPALQRRALLCLVSSRVQSCLLLSILVSTCPTLGKTWQNKWKVGLGRRNTNHQTKTEEKLCPKGCVFCPMKLSKNINITVQKHKCFVPRQNIDVHEQELMKCKYVLLAFSSKPTLRPSKFVFAALNLWDSTFFNTHDKHRKNVPWVH